MSGCECKPDAKRKRDSAQPQDAKRKRDSAQPQERAQPSTKCLPARRLVEANRIVHQLFHERNAVELDELNIFLHTAVEREANLPGSCKDIRVLDGRLILDVVRADA